jgi:bifunctional non-homologous end joining protein LigD
MASRHTATRDRTIGTYRAKRDFTVSPEPAPSRPRKAGKSRIFVVQKHDASRLHYDFRLEHNGVLLSWAVPKGPSMTQGEKRLAVHVEDHPVDYATFEGVIPEGNYGAGTVEIWDHGTWQPVEADADRALAKGDLKFDLAGERLHGRFVLVRMKPKPKERAENWLLIKERDAADAAPAKRAPARKVAPPAKGKATRQRSAQKPAAPAWAAPEDAVAAPMPAAQAPMLASNADAPPEGDEWLSEIKFDGYRLMVRKDTEGVRLITRNGLDWTKRFAGIAAAVRALPADTLLADGEVVALREDGVSSFAMLQNALSEGRTDGLVLYLFDLLYRDGMDLRACALAARKAGLADLTQPEGVIRYSEHLIGVTARMRTQACAMGLEGIICKRADAPYRGGRSRTWLKVKCQGREEFVVLGYTKPQGSRSGLGALQLGYYDPSGALHYAGGCGSGFSDAALNDLAKRLATDKAERPADMLLTEEPPPKAVTWVKPSLVAEVQYTAWSGAGRLRHAVFLGMRQDKDVSDVVREIADPEVKRRRYGGLDAPVVVTARKPAPRKPGAARHAAHPEKTVAVAAVSTAVKLTHPERELWPGITKQDLAEYWQMVASAALPGIAHRPLAFVRCPDGIDGQHFFQKHAHKGMMSTLREGDFDGAPYLALDDAEGLRACAQIAAVELHAWGATEADAGHPDQLVFDLDPGEGTSWADVIAGARDLRKRLEMAGLAVFPRTSGGKGLHLVVPLAPQADWDTARAWCRAFAEGCERDAPEKYVSSVQKARRRGRILIDWLRNGLGSTAAASFTPRARPNATVATPLNWTEVTAKLDPQRFTIKTVPKRLSAQKKDPWAGFNACRVVLPVPSMKEKKRG